jgi:hypothetical protein
MLLFNCADGDPGSGDERGGEERPADEELSGGETPRTAESS